MSEKKFPLKLIALCLLAVILPGLWAANTVGLIDLRSSLAKVPYLGLYFQPTPPQEPVINMVSPLEEENNELRDKLKETQNSNLILESEKTTLLMEQEKLQSELLALRKYKEEQEQQVINLQQMAEYYKRMKAEEVVRIMNNLDDNTLIKILPLLDKDQAGKIMGLMDPQRAALITQRLLEG